MANSVFSLTPLLGVNFDEKRSTVDGPAVAVGTVVQVTSTNTPAAIGKFAMYVQASAAIGNSAYTTVALTSVSCLATSVDGGSGTAYTRNGSVAFAASEYGWVYIVRTGIFQA